MANQRQAIHLGLAFVFVGVLFTASVNAAVKYEFRVTEQPADDFHIPLVAELWLSNAAVTAGQAIDSDIESLQITGGTAVRSESPLTLSHAHPAFVNRTVTLSEDRNTITAISAIVTPHNSPIDHLVLHQQNPPHPTLEVHENLGYIHSNYVRLETMLLPVPPETRISVFNGEWQQATDKGTFLNIKEFIERLTCFPFCPLPWLVIFAAIVLPVLVRRIRQRRAENSQ